MGSLGSSFLLNRYNEHLEHSSINFWEMGEGTLSTQSICPAWFSSGTGNLLGPWESGASPVGLVRFAAVLFRCAPPVSLAGPVSCAAFTAAVTAFYHRHRNDHYQDHSILLGMACGIVFGLGTGKTLQTTILSILPWLVTLSLVLSSAAHRVMQRHSAGDNAWYCCHCGDNSARCCTPVGCFMCGHSRCDSCSIVPEH